MRITKKSPVTGEFNTREINCTPAQLAAWRNRDGLIQNVMPQLDADDREFLISGCTPEDWEVLFGKEEA
jgi:hypothetical protein